MTTNTKQTRGLGLASPWRRFNWPWWKHWLNVRWTYWYAIRAFVHRGLYGWSGHDVMSIDMYISDIIAEMLECYLEVSRHMFYEDTDESWLIEDRNSLQKRSDVRRVIAAFRADANECTHMMCDHALSEKDWDKKKAHAEYWVTERKWAFTWLQEHWSGLWT